MSDHPASPLRERAKARRRRSIQLAALRLFAERGYDGTTLGDIAEAADVAPRTVSLYFPSKPDLALSQANEVAERLSGTIHANPGARFLELMALWLSREAESRDRELAAATEAMRAANPQLRALGTAPIAEVMKLAGSALVAELDLAADDLMTALTTAGISAVVTQYLAADEEPTPARQAAVLAFLRIMIESASASG